MQNIYKLIQKYNKDKIRKSKIKKHATDYFLALYVLTKPKPKKKIKALPTQPKTQYRNETGRLTETSI